MVMGAQPCIHIGGLADIHTAGLFAKNRIDIKHPRCQRGGAMPRGDLNRPIATNVGFGCLAQTFPRVESAS
jgi:hypothetical protein